MDEPPGSHLLDVVAVMDALRVSCPWDAEQTHRSLLKYLLEEAYEAADAIETGDMESLKEELGDVLLQAVFHARVASERSVSEGGFTIDDVADVLVAKLRRRHPHVFGSVSASSADEVNRNWDEIKKAEKAERASASGSGPASVLDGVAFGQPALSLAAQLLRRAERAGFPVPPGTPGGSGSSDSSGPRGPGGSAPSGASGSSGASSFSGSSGPGGLGGSGSGSEGSDPDAERIGADLMRLVARARAAGVDPELALREEARAFAARVRAWEHSHG